MAHFNLELNDFLDENTFATALGNNLTVEAGAPKTTATQSDRVNLSTTSYDLSGIMQGNALFRPQGYVYDNFNQTLSSDLGGLIESEGGAEQILGGRQTLLPWDVLERAGYNDSRFTNGAGSALGAAVAAGGTAVGADTPFEYTGPASDPGSYGRDFSPSMKYARDQVNFWFHPDSVGGYGTRSGSTDHDDYRAFDYMVSGGVAQGEQKTKGDNIALWHQKHAEALGVKYIIWWIKIWNFSERHESIDLPLAQWRAYTNTDGSANRNHQNHVHVSFIP